MSHPTQTAQHFETACTLDYLLHLPASYDAEPERHWPLIVFLHGIGERGSDLEKVKLHGIPMHVERDPDFPFVTLSPQCPDGLYWPHVVVLLGGLIRDTLARLRVDPDRVYLTGLSMGGQGTWELAMTYPELFAAIAPICGPLPASHRSRSAAIAHLPIWVFHGEDDPVVPLEDSLAMVGMLQASGAEPRLTVYPGVEHDSWIATYADPALYEWLLQHERPHVE
jgi:predicted peptidase